MIKVILFGVGTIVFAFTAITLSNFSGRLLYSKTDKPNILAPIPYLHNDVQAAVLRSVEFQDLQIRAESGRTVPVEVPKQILIPSIHVDATLESVGLTVRGNVDTPKGPASPAWYSLGPRPGAVGNAVIVGHYGWKNNIPAVFDHISRLQKGDRITVLDESGNKVVFAVQKLRTYGEHDTAYEVFLSSDGKSHLNLITCSGVWNKKSKSYSSRTVVFADRVSE